MSSYEPIDPATLSAEQRALYEQYTVGSPTAGVGRRRADNEFCYMLELHGIPLVPPYRA